MKKYRILAAIGSLILGVFSFGGYAAWAIADFYFGADQVHFVLVLGTCIFLLVLALYWVFFAIVGYRLVSSKWNRLLLWLSILMGIPGCIFVLTFFV